MYHSRKPNVAYFKVFGCMCFVLHTKDNLGKFNAKAFEAIFICYSNTSKAYRVFNKFSLTIEESMHVKFEESEAFIKNVVEIDTLREDMEKVSLEDSPTQEDKQKLNSEVQEDEVEPSQPLSKDWRYATSHPKDFIISDVSKEVSATPNSMILCGHYAFISHIEPKNILEAEGDSYWLLAMQEERNQVWHLVPRPHDRPTISTK